MLRKPSNEEALRYIRLQVKYVNKMWYLSFDRSLCLSLRAFLSPNMFLSLCLSLSLSYTFFISFSLLFAIYLSLLLALNLYIFLNLALEFFL